MRNSFMKDLREREKQTARLKPKKVSSKRAKSREERMVARNFLHFVVESLNSMARLDEVNVITEMCNPNKMRIGIGRLYVAQLIDQAFYLTLNKEDYTTATINSNLSVSENVKNYIEQQEQTEHRHCIQLREEIYNLSCGTEFSQQFIELKDIGLIIENGVLMGLLALLFEELEIMYQEIIKRAEEHASRSMFAGRMGSGKSMFGAYAQAWMTKTRSNPPKIMFLDLENTNHYHTFINPSSEIWKHFGTK